MCKWPITYKKSYEHSKNANFRRNQRGDHARALKTVEEIIRNTKDKATLSPDIICLAGRIYKDKFISSNYEDRESLNSAIHWYVYEYEQKCTSSENLSKTSWAPAPWADRIRPLPLLFPKKWLLWWIKIINTLTGPSSGTVGALRASSM